MSDQLDRDDELEESLLNEPIPDWDEDEYDDEDEGDLADVDFPDDMEEPDANT